MPTSISYCFIFVGFYCNLQHNFHFCCSSIFIFIAIDVDEMRCTTPTTTVSSLFFLRCHQPSSSFPMTIYIDPHNYFPFCCLLLYLLRNISFSVSLCHFLQTISILCPPRFALSLRQPTCPTN